MRILGFYTTGDRLLVVGCWLLVIVVDAIVVVVVVVAVVVVAVGC